MLLQRSKPYVILSAACAAGYAWLCYVLAATADNTNIASVCLIKQGTGMPCPSCGSTRSVVSLLHGDLLHALYLNPLGIIVLLVMLVAPLWIIYDVVFSRYSLLLWYRKVEQVFKKPPVAILLIALVLINWIWNIVKGI